MHGQGADLRRARYAVAPTGGVAAVARPGTRRPRRADDAERAAVPGGAGCRAARRLRGRQRQSALHPARAGAPAQGQRRRSDHHPGELRDDAAAGAAEHAGQAHRGGQYGRHARRPERHARQFCRAQRQEDGAGVGAPQLHPLQHRPAGKAPGRRSSPRQSAPTTSPSCSTRAAPPVCRRARRCCTGTSSPTCCSPRRG